MRQRHCDVPGCDEPHSCKGYCAVHYGRLRRTGTTDLIARRPGRSELTFERLVLIETEDHVLWPLHVGVRGYGIVTMCGRNHYVHRLALERHTAPQPLDVYACHKPSIGCDKRCMNYRHLYWGSPAMNAGDKVIDGISGRGVEHHAAKLTENDVREIRRRREAGEQYKPIAADFGVSPHTIRAIITRANWGWLK